MSNFSKILNGAIPLFRVFGIRLSVHWTFLPLLAYIAWNGWRLTNSIDGLIWSVMCILLIFACVVMHELGHCFMAERFGVQVPHILLMPIGGMAEFSHIPRNALQEILIALGGPLVNFALVLILHDLVALKSWSELPQLMDHVALTPNGIFRVLLFTNLFMGLFNLLPVFPMDGGRVLRAWLSRHMSYLDATRRATNLAKVLAVVGIAVMTFWLKHPMGAILFIFIIVAGELEYRAVVREESP